MPCLQEIHKCEYHKQCNIDYNPLKVNTTKYLLYQYLTLK